MLSDICYLTRIAEAGGKGNGDRKQEAMNCLSTASSISTDWFEKGRRFFFDGPQYE